MGSVPCCQPQKFAAESSPPDIEGSIQECAGMLPVAEVCAASSAVAGFAALEGLDLELLLPGCDPLFPSGLQVAPWISNAPDGKALTQGNALVEKLFKQDHVSQELLDELAAGCVRGVVDAGFTDGTGIAKAVAMGATRVTALLNLNSGADYEMGSFLLRLFQGGADVGNASGFRVFEPIFEEDAASVKKKYENLEEIQPTEECNVLTGIEVGTITATTCESKAFGIDARTTITINVVSVGSNAPIGPPVDYFIYDQLVQEIMDSLLASGRPEHIMKHVLLPMFIQ